MPGGSPSVALEALDRRARLASPAPRSVARLVVGDRLRDVGRLLHRSPSTRVMTSPCLIPARSAGPPETRRLHLGAAGGGADAGPLVSTPEVGALDRSRRATSTGTTWRTVFDGTAKPMPTLPWLPAGRDLRVHADHAPGVVEQRAARVAGVDRGVGLDDLVDREAVGRLDLRVPMPETMPSVAVRSRPKGLPIAIATSPTRTLRESASRSGFTPFGASCRSRCYTARSLDGSVPSTVRRRSSCVSGPKRTSTWSLAPTTWAFVTSVPCDRRGSPCRRRCPS